MVEFAAANAETHRTFVGDVHGVTVADDSNAKSSDRLKRSGLPIIVDVDLEILDNLWEDISPVNSMAGERMGYQTQKPLGLLERIITASSAEGESDKKPPKKAKKAKAKQS